MQNKSSSYWRRLQVGETRTTGDILSDTDPDYQGPGADGFPVVAIGDTVLDKSCCPSWRRTDRLDGAWRRVEKGEIVLDGDVWSAQDPSVDSTDSGPTGIGGRQIKYSATGCRPLWRRVVSEQSDSIEDAARLFCEELSSALLSQILSELFEPGTGGEILVTVRDIAATLKRIEAALQPAQKAPVIEPKPAWIRVTVGDIIKEGDVWCNAYPDKNCSGQAVDASIGATLKPSSSPLWRRVETVIEPEHISGQTPVPAAPTEYRQLEAGEIIQSGDFVRRRPAGFRVRVYRKAVPADVFHI